MKIAKRIAAVIFSLAASVILLQVTGTDAQAAKAPKTHTYVVDKKSKVGYPTAVRTGANGEYYHTHGSSFSIYLPNTGDFVAKVSSNSSNLITKVTRKYTIKDKDGYTGGYYFDDDTKFKGYSDITCFATKPGNYKVTVTIKNAKKKQIAKKTINVYASTDSAIESVTYAGKSIEYGNQPTGKAKGKLSVKVGKDYTVKKIEVGGFKEDGTIAYKTVKNNSTITLSNVKAYKENDYSYQGYSYSYESGTSYDYIYPMTSVRITVYDKKLKITAEYEYEIFKK